MKNEAHKVANVPLDLFQDLEIKIIMKILAKDKLVVIRKIIVIQVQSAQPEKSRNESTL